jgi:hypothetical protein
MAAGRGDWGWAVTARSLYLVSMAIFLVTISIGIPNGLDVVEFDRNQILTHVHSGTIGWLTLSLVAATFVLFRVADARLATSLAIAVPVYVAAFYTGSYVLRAVTGVVLLALVVWLVVWAWRSFLAGPRSLPRLGITLALTTFAYGAIVGVLLQVQFATASTILPGDGIGAHAGAMTFGYLVLAGMSIAEWRVLRTTSMPRLGLVQLLALFLGGLVISAALLTNQPQVGGGIYLLAELIAVVLFVVRVVPKAVRTDWLAASAGRHLGAAAIWIVAAMAVFMYLVSKIMADPNLTPADPSVGGMLIASDHSVYIGVITNSTFAILATLVAGSASGGFAIARHVAFWGMNLGLLVFAIGLVTGTVILKEIGAPTMGVCLLVGLAVYAYGLVSERREPAPEAIAAPA